MAVVGVAAIALVTRQGNPAADFNRTPIKTPSGVVATQVQPQTQPPPIAGVVGPTAAATAIPASLATQTATPVSRIATAATSTSTSRPPATPAPGATIYTAKAGDTLWSISRGFGISVQELMQANGLTDPNRVVVGQRLVIPR